MKIKLNLLGFSGIIGIIIKLLILVGVILQFLKIFWGFFLMNCIYMKFESGLSWNVLDYN